MSTPEDQSLDFKIVSIIAALLLVGAVAGCVALLFKCGEALKNCCWLLTYRPQLPDWANRNVPLVRLHRLTETMPVYDAAGTYGSSTSTSIPKPHECV